jgi:iron complex outermembrane receptor protein
VDTLGVGPATRALGVLRLKFKAWVLTGLFGLSPAVCWAQAPSDLSRMSIEELSNIEVTSVSKRPERLADAAASVFVLSNDDLRRSGVQTLPEALRLAPNLNVQRVDALDYGISARGLNGFESANKLLVLVDGRSVYSPFFSGVEWSQIQPDLLDVDRIEVVSGPGGTLWGANAVNGVINIVSRPADLTQGLAGQAAAGDGYQFYGLRYGGRIGAEGAYRVYARGFDRADTLRDGRNAGDGWRGGQVGFRTDLAGQTSHFTLQGDAYYDHVPSQIPSHPNGKLVGENLLGRWTHSFSDDSEFEVQAYYDRYERIARGILDGVKTYDVQAQQRVALGSHKLVVGAGYRRWSDRFANFVNGFVLDPADQTSDLLNGFVQDQVSLGDLTLTLGLKAEHSSLSGTSWLPNARLAWRVADNTLLWTAVSRAIRNPSRLDRDLVFPPFLVSSDFEPERLVAYELGYRGQPWSRLSLSATLFYHDYEGVRSNEPTPGSVLPIRIGNGLEGETWGLEAWGDLDVTDAWRLSAGGTAMHKRFRAAAGSAELSQLAAQGHDPGFQVLLRSQHRLSDTVNLDVRFRYVSSVPAELVDNYIDAPAYAEADARLSWRVTDRVELALAGVNLLHASHPEATEPRRTEARRNFQLSLRYGW